MDYTKFIDTIVEKYGYKDNIRKAIEITLPLMVNKYGVGRLDEILSVFSDVKIFGISKLEQSEYDRIEEEMTMDINKHIASEANTDYGHDSVPGSIYGYNAIYDENLDVVGERRWIVVQEIEGPRKKDYEELFGTNVNIPYFIHEINHAFAMQKASYRKEGNKVYSKHGMYESIDEFQIDEAGQIKEVRVSEENLLVEELVNEKTTQDMLVDFLKVDDYSKIKEKLTAIGHVSSNYGATLMMLAENLETRIGTENMLKWRLDNDTSIKDNFNQIARPTKIAETYFKDEEPFAYFSAKAHEIFLNNCNSYKMSIPEYEQRNLVGLMDAMAPICAYREGIGEKDFWFYANIRNNALPDENKKLDEENKAL